MAKVTLNQILSELNPLYQPQVQQLRQRQSLIPGQVAQEEQGLNAKKDAAYEDIISGARRRGVAFGGIPLAEQAKYAATDYAPALARLRQTGREQAMSLEDAILGLNREKGTMAQQLLQSRRDRNEQKRQFNQQMAFNRESLAAQERSSARAAAASAAAMPSLGDLFGGGAGGGGEKKNPNAGKAEMLQNGADFQFRLKGKPITAAQYAANQGEDIRDLVYKMAQYGDSSAKSLYNYFNYHDQTGKWNVSWQWLKKNFPQILGGV